MYSEHFGKTCQTVRIRDGAKASVFNFTNLLVYNE